MAIKTVTMSCPTEGARIYYTTDGSIPDQTKTLYTGAFQVDDTEVGVVQAVAYKEMMTWSDVAYDIVGTHKLATPYLTVTRNSNGRIYCNLVNTNSYPVNTIITLNWETLSESGSETYTIIGNDGTVKIFDKNITIPNKLSLNCSATFDNPLYKPSDSFTLDTYPLIDEPVIELRFNQAYIHPSTLYENAVGYYKINNGSEVPIESYPFRVNLNDNDTIVTAYKHIDETNGSYQSQLSASATYHEPDITQNWTEIDTASIGGGSQILDMYYDEAKNMYICSFYQKKGIAFLAYSNDGVTWSPCTANSDLQETIDSYDSVTTYMSYVYYHTRLRKFYCIWCARCISGSTAKTIWRVLASADGKAWSHNSMTFVTDDVDYTKPMYVGSGEERKQISYISTSGSARMFTTENGVTWSEVESMYLPIQNIAVPVYTMRNPASFVAYNQYMLPNNKGDGEISGPWYTIETPNSYGVLYYADDLVQSFFGGLRKVNDTQFMYRENPLNDTYGSVTLSYNEKTINITTAQSSATAVGGGMMANDRVAIIIPNFGNILIYSYDGGVTWNEYQRNSSDSYLENTRYGTRRCGNKFFIYHGVMGKTLMYDCM